MKGGFVLALGLFVLLLFLAHTAGIYPVEVKAVNGHPVHNLDTGLNYTAIQEAIDANETLDGHTIFVESGTYYEHVVINKSLSLVGEDREETIIEGNGTRRGISIQRSNVSVSGFTVENFLDGISVGMKSRTVREVIIDGNIISNSQIGIDILGTFPWSSIYGDHHLVKNNIVENNTYGIRLQGCFNVTICQNEVKNNTENGIELVSTPDQPIEVRGSYYNLIMSNTIAHNGLGIFISGRSRENVFYHNNFIDNIVQVSNNGNNTWDNGYPSGGNYWSNYNGTDLFISEPGIKPGDWIEYDLNWTDPPGSPYAVWIRDEILEVNGSVITIERLQVMDDGSVKNRTETGDIVEGTGVAAAVFIPAGLQPGDSVSIEGFGVVLINGTEQRTYMGTERTVVWADFLRMGFDILIYWDKETGVALELHTKHITRLGITMINNTNMWTSGSDGIGDSPYVSDGNNRDDYPLMGMFSSFNATPEHHVQTVCNSTISNFRFDGAAISFNVTGEEGTTGFCRILVPTALMNKTYRVLVNGAEVSHDLLPFSNSTHSYLYFTYNHSTQEVTIMPEFPSFIILLLIMIATLTAPTFYRKRTK